MDTVDSSNWDCTAPEIGRLLLDYVLNGLDEDRSTGFEAHLLECDACYANFTALVRTSSYLADMVKADVGQLPPAVAFLRQRTRTRWLKRALAAAALLCLGFAVGYLMGSAKSRSGGSSGVGGLRPPHHTPFHAG